jgi:hypothetical protein
MNIEQQRWITNLLEEGIAVGDMLTVKPHVFARSTYMRARVKEIPNGPLGIAAREFLAERLHVTMVQIGEWELQFLEEHPKYALLPGDVGYSARRSRPQQARALVVESLEGECIRVEEAPKNAAAKAGKAYVETGLANMKSANSHRRRSQKVDTPTAMAYGMGNMLIQQGQNKRTRAFQGQREHRDR